MRRPERQKTIRERLARYRDIVPDLAMRTTVHRRLPGRDRRRLPGALRFPRGDAVRPRRVLHLLAAGRHARRATSRTTCRTSIKRERKERIEELQRAITAERYERFLGRETRVLVDRAGDAPGQLRRARAVAGRRHRRDRARHGRRARPVRSSTCGSSRWWTTTISGRRGAGSPTRRLPCASAPTRHLPLVGTTTPSAGSYGR